MAEFLFAPTPNQAAIAFIASKPALSREVFDKLLPELKARAFTISGVHSADIVQHARDAIAELPAGGDWNEIKGRIAPTLLPYFVDPNAEPEVQKKQAEAADRRAELLLRTHGQQAYAVAQHDMLTEQTDLFPNWQYLTLGDDHVRPTHAALDGIVLPADHEFWKTHTPPWEWGCRCQLVPLTDSDTAAIAEKQKNRAKDNQDVLDENAQADLTATRRLVRNGVTYNVTAPREQGTPGAFTFNPGDLRIPIESLKARYDAPVFAAFEKWARGQGIEELGTSVWDWLNGETLRMAATAVARRAPVSAALNVVASGAHGELISRTIAVIDATHDDGKLPSVVIDAHPGEDALGSYNYRTHQIGIRESGQWPALTTCHEIGHLIDNQALGVRGEWASRGHKDLKAFRKAVDASDSTRDIENLTNRRRSRYMLDRREQFARAYAQYIAETSSDPTLLANLARVRSDVFEYWRQWSTRDFAPIRKALDDLFTKKGWL